MRTKTKLFIAILLVIALMMGCNLSFAELNDVSQLYIPLSKDNEITVEFAFDFIKNLIFETYPVSVYLDNSHIVDLPHGQGYEGKIKVNPGKHKLCIYKSDDKNWNGIFEFEAYEYTFIVGEIRTRYSRVDVNELKTQKRYSLVSGEYLNWLKEYDTVMENLHYYFDTAYEYRKQVGKHTKGHQNYYYLFNSKGNNYMYFGENTYPYSNTKVYAPRFGTYSGDLNSGSVKIIEFSDPRTEAVFSDYGNMVIDFQKACEAFIHINDKDLYKKCSELIGYLYKNEPLYYRLIFPNGFLY